MAVRIRKTMTTTEAVTARFDITRGAEGALLLDAGQVDGGAPNMRSMRELLAADLLPPIDVPHGQRLAILAEVTVHVVDEAEPTPRVTIPGHRGPGFFETVGLDERYRPGVVSATVKPGAEVERGELVTSDRVVVAPVPPAPPPGRFVWLVLRDALGQDRLRVHGLVGGPSLLADFAEHGADLDRNGQRAGNAVDGLREALHRAPPSWSLRPRAHALLEQCRRWPDAILYVGRERTYNVQHRTPTPGDALIGPGT